MSDVEVTYNGRQIATMNASGSKTLKTKNKLCVDNIRIDYTKSSVVSAPWNDVNFYDTDTCRRDCIHGDTIRLQNLCSERGVGDVSERDCMERIHELFGRRIKMNCNEFIEYLIEQVRNGSIYVWGGQGQKAPTVCEAWIRRREAGTGGTIVNKRYETYADIAVNTWKKRVREGYGNVLRAFDCSGLGVYWFIKYKLIRYDMNANALRGLCERVLEPRRGYWVFRVKDNRATHIGYLISPTELIEAKGRQDGVVRRPYKPGEWTEIGKPKIFDFDDHPDPEPPQPEKREYVKVVGESVHVREGNGTETKKLGTVHNDAYYKKAQIEKPGDMLPYLGQAEEAPNWYRVEYEGRAAYITNKPRYTAIVTKEEIK